MKKLLTKLSNAVQNLAVGAIVGWFVFALSFDFMAILMVAFFPNEWSEVVYRMNQVLGI
jgi:hypothetical protein